MVISVGSIPSKLSLRSVRYFKARATSTRNLREIGAVVHLCVEKLFTFAWSSRSPLRGAVVHLCVEQSFTFAWSSRSPTCGEVIHLCVEKSFTYAWSSCSPLHLQNCINKQLSAFCNQVNNQAIKKHKYF